MSMRPSRFIGFGSSNSIIKKLLNKNQFINKIK